MSKVIVLTDSTAYIPQKYIDSLPIEVVPLLVTWDGKTYRDGINITPKDFYTMLAKSSTLLPTRQELVNHFQ